MNELLEILYGLKGEICPMVQDASQRQIIEGNFDRAIEIVTDKSSVDYLRGKVEAYENTLGGNN